MDTSNLLWVLGHRIRPLDTDVSYGMIEVTSPPHVPGPPPHFHKSENEFFLIVKGTLDVMINGEWQRCGAGSFLDLQPNTTHTFVNNTEEDVVWITGWRPKGFERFFRDFGIPAAEQDAEHKSVADQVVQKVVQNVENYGMYLAK
ncbi:cupin domain-containing protein [Methylococcus sp. ANG]|uniref:cupin domain-containing protein n=1 Tax=Methylococcus sp. ANG TaxID=3231903 RepID=UPI003459DAAF